MSDTGGGHRASAKAIGEALEYLYPGRYEVIIEDVWSNHMPWPMNLLPDTYGWLSGPGKPLWALLWMVTSYRKMQSAMFTSVAPIIKDSVASYIASAKPDLCVSVHPLMNHLGMKWIEQAGLNIPFITVVTDMVSLHPSWICPEVDRCLVSTEEAKDRALKFGMPEEKIAVHGQPVSLKFSRTRGKKYEFKEKLGLDPMRPAVLLVGGGEGYGQLYKIARRISATVSRAQLLVVSGRNRKLKKRLEQANWEIPTRVFGFVNNMPDLMGASDILVTKAGPGTISEAFIAGLPPLICGYIPGQEAGNVKYVIRHRAGSYARTSRKIAKTVQDWVDGAGTNLQVLARNAARLARPNASFDIAADIHKFV